MREKGTTGEQGASCGDILSDTSTAHKVEEDDEENCSYI